MPSGKEHPLARARLSPPSPPPGYPSDIEGTLRLDDGQVVFIRPIVPEDAPIIAAEIAAADPETVYQRFFTPAVKLDAAQLRHLTELDYTSSFAVVALTSDGEGIAVVRYAPLPGRPREAEVAFTVKPQWRRLGLATSLYAIAEARAVVGGMRILRAYYLAGNDAAAALLASLGFRHPVREDGVVEVHVRIDGGECAPVATHS